MGDADPAYHPGYELTTGVPEVRDGELVVPDGPGWGCDVREDVLREHARSR